MNKEVLFKAEYETLELIKNEAEKNLIGIQNSEDVITNKSNNLIRILLPILLILLGVLINSITIQNLDWKFQLSLLISILLFIVIYYLYENILPVKSATQGFDPNELVVSELILGDGKNDNRNILLNCIYSLQSSILKSRKSHKIRYDRFRTSNKILFLGLFLITFIILTFQFSLLFQDM